MSEEKKNYRLLDKEELGEMHSRLREIFYSFTYRIKNHSPSDEVKTVYCATVQALLAVDAELRTREEQDDPKKPLYLRAKI